MFALWEKGEIRKNSVGQLRRAAAFRLFQFAFVCVERINDLALGLMQSKDQFLHRRVEASNQAAEKFGASGHFREHLDALDVQHFTFHDAALDLQGFVFLEKIEQNAGGNGRITNAERQRGWSFQQRVERRIACFLEGNLHECIAGDDQARAV